MTNLKQNFQFAYNSLIDLANGAYENSNNRDLKDAGLDNYWIGKAEAYEYGAHILDNSAALSGIFIGTRVSDRQRDINQARQEDCAADAEIENEPEEVRENQPY